MPASQHDVDRLTTLIAYASANADACFEAANDAEGFRVAASLTHRAQERRAVAAHLRGCLQQDGSGEAPSSISSPAPVAPRFEARRGVAPADARVVEMAGRDDEELQAAFESALDDDALSPQARMVVLKAYVAVRTGGDQMRDLHRSLQNGA
ncbi:hypothetical protein ATSB10_35110 [Dyella thiooxydans]|uniref:DUF2383 domain-containing protein n=1 Tax=Dyella thiooxydans TaxID=445710 RepID=A0A161JXP4_9GAMM|nr:PA2169 family four-helix-bundle protein [Dyella thiooxydans]AND70965.1 hypothetical protein ATSB10_35110 [Dyella thiooxydans]